MKFYKAVHHFSRMKKIFIAAGIMLIMALNAKAQQNMEQPHHEPYRLQVHFSPKAHWINDPNGMVYFNHTWHLFYQYYPDGTTWGRCTGDMQKARICSIGKKLPIALYPDSLGYIFSGSIVADVTNTSGFGIMEKSLL